MTKFKVGDRVKLNKACQYIGGKYGYSCGDVGVIENPSDDGYIKFRMTQPMNGYEFLWCVSGELDFTDETPPTTIEHEGYTYTRGERVLPDWLEDGAWVVNVVSGDLRQVHEVSPGVFNLTTGTPISIRYGGHIRDQYRPHEPSDYKWGDWAMYDGDKVFVMGRKQGDFIFVSHADFSDGMSFVDVTDLTPTHAP